MAKDYTTDPVDDVQARVSGRLRALRTERGLTLAEVAERAGMDASTLSRLESGARRLTLDHLPVLARALGVRADDLLGAPPVEDPRVRTKPKIRDGMTFWELHRHPEGPAPHAFKIRLPADRREPILREHEGATGSTSSAAGCGSSSATRSTCCSQGRRWTSTRGRRTGSASSTAQRRSSGSSARRASRCTSAQRSCRSGTFACQAAARPEP
jgi:transcriptional regulator with XRE-family HTH domain